MLFNFPHFATSENFNTCKSFFSISLKTEEKIIIANMVILSNDKFKKRVCGSFETHFHLFLKKIRTLNIVLSVSNRNRLGI